ncbi:MAG TPA: hypothetical protein ENK28_07230, partial [Aliiroseovarius sp.]|nr:hypothetical protein [Aliiroseovarius sp.]
LFRSLWQTAPGGDLNTHRDVYIHDNVISWFKNDAIRIEGFHNTRIERNVIESDAGEGGGQGNGVVFTRGKTSPEITGYRTILRDNIIQNNPRFGIDNQMPGSHTFVSTGNTLFGNLAGPYNNVASHDDSFAEPPISDVLQRVYYDVLSPAWKHALATQDFRGDMNARQAWALYQR